MLLSIKCQCLDEFSFILKVHIPIDCEGSPIEPSSTEDIDQMSPTFCWLKLWESVPGNPDHFSCRAEGKMTYQAFLILFYIFHKRCQYENKSILNCAFSLVLERKISTRQSREELIRRGVLKEMPEQGDNMLPRI